MLQILKFLDGIIGKIKTIFSLDGYFRIHIPDIKVRFVKKGRQSNHLQEKASQKNNTNLQRCEFQPFFLKKENLNLLS